MDLKQLPRLEEVLKKAHASRATDVYLVPGEPPAVRQGRAVVRLEMRPVSPAEIKEIAIAAIGKDHVERIGKEVAEVTRSSLTGPEVYASFCVARSHSDLTISITLAPPTIANVADIAVPDAVLRVATSPSGLLVFSGPVGSGKTTTAYSVVNYINQTMARHIGTVEEPAFVRFRPGKSLVQQREVGFDVPTALAGIHAAIKQAQDVLFVNEIKSLEELQACFGAAEQGLLVIVVLHAPTPEGVVQRLVDAFPEDVRGISRKVVASVLRGVCAQRLLPRADRGRVAIYGVLIPDEEMRAAIAEGRDFLTRKKEWPAGCQTMADDVERLHEEGIISKETAETARTELA